MNKPRTLLVLVLSIAVGISTLPNSVAAQSVPETAWGRPDFQGNWTNKTVTPFQRPTDTPNLLLTPEQFQDIQENRVQVLEERLEQGLQAIDPENRPELSDGRAELGQAYDEFWWDRGDRVAIVNGEPRASLMTVPENGRMPEYTDEAARILEGEREFRSQFGDRDHPELRPLAERCIAFGTGSTPPIMPVGAYNSNFTIVQTPDHLMVMAEMIHDARIVPIGDGPDDPARDHLRVPAHVRPWGGVSWGWWEGDTLVVETTNAEPRINAQYPSSVYTEEGSMLSEGKKITEKFSRYDEGTLVYEFLVEDPAVYEEPWGGQIPFNPLGDLVFEYACHEGNYGFESVLRGARYEESLEAAQPEAR